MDVFHTNLELHCNKGPETGGIEDARHAEDAVSREAADLIGHMAHGVEGIADNDQNGLRGKPDNLLSHIFHDFSVGG
jgi:hypothetical protein